MPTRDEIIDLTAKLRAESLLIDAEREQLFSLNQQVNLSLTPLHTFGSLLIVTFTISPFCGDVACLHEMPQGCTVTERQNCLSYS